jgi:hypothetical protein
MSKPLRMWTVYERPSDYPENYVARLFEVDAVGSHATENIVIAPDLEFLRALMIGMGLVKMVRDPKDDPVIVEVWI